MQTVVGVFSCCLYTKRDVDGLGGGMKQNNKSNLEFINAGNIFSRILHNPVVLVLKSQ